MATFHSQEPLLLDVIPPDEDMELSSDVDHRPDGEDIDVDVDVDLTSDRPPDGDDDYLIEDAHPEVVEDLLAVPEGINDDVMHDEDRTSLVMEDDTLVPDEELVDVENIGQGLIGTSTDDLGTADADAIALPRTPPFADDETQLKAAVASPEKAHSLQAPENPIDDVSDKTPAAGAVSTLDPSSEQDGRDYSGESGTAAEQDLRSPSGTAEHDEVLAIPFSEQESSGALGEGASLAHDPSAHEIGQDGERSNGIAQVLPVVIGYEGSQVSLFPPSKDDSSETFFLKDEGLANSTISKLFGALRSVLAESIDEDDELEFGLDIFGLSIREDSLHARISTLAEILELHARLLRNDGVEYPDAFYMTLTAKPGLPRRLRDIAEAVAEGKGLSYVATWDDEETGQEAEEASESPHRPNTDTSNTRDDHGHGTAPGVGSNSEQALELAETSSRQGSRRGEEAYLEDLGDEPLPSPSGRVNSQAGPEEPRHSPFGPIGQSTAGAPDHAAHRSGGEAADADASADGDLIDYEEPGNEGDGDVVAEEEGSNGSSTVQADEDAVRDAEPVETSGSNARREADASPTHSHSALDAEESPAQPAAEDEGFDESVGEERFAESDQAGLGTGDTTGFSGNGEAEEAHQPVDFYQDDATDAGGTYRYLDTALEGHEVSGNNGDVEAQESYDDVEGEIQPAHAYPEDGSGADGVRDDYLNQQWDPPLDELPGSVIEQSLDEAGKVDLEYPEHDPAPGTYDDSHSLLIGADGEDDDFGAHTDNGDDGQGYEDEAARAAVDSTDIISLDGDPKSMKRSRVDAEDEEGLDVNIQGIKRIRST